MTKERNQLIDYAAQRLGHVRVDEALRSCVEHELKQGWQTLINQTPNRECKVAGVAIAQKPKL